MRGFRLGRDDRDGERVNDMRYTAQICGIVRKRTSEKETWWTMDLTLYYVGEPTPISRDRRARWNRAPLSGAKSRLKAHLLFSLDYCIDRWEGYIMHEGEQATPYSHLLPQIEPSDRSALKSVVGASLRVGCSKLLSRYAHGMCK